MKQKFIIIIVMLLIFNHLQCQEKKKYLSRTIAFYNVENLFDTTDDPNTFDDARTPNGADRWTEKVYRDHIEKIAKVIADIGTDVNGLPPDVIGLAEVENMTVLVDLVNTKHLKKHNYGIIHYDSPDSRGIDVAFLYRKDIFKPTFHKNYPLLLQDKNGKRRKTRDQLFVSGYLDGELFHFIINHWPSRNIGEKETQPLREAAAELTKSLIINQLEKDSQANIIVMGDFNDNPTDASLKNVLKTKSKKEEITSNSDLYNPMETMFSKGIGTLAYNDSWHLFDQIFFTGNLLQNQQKSFRFWKASIFNKSYLAVQKGKNKGYPFRSMQNGNYSWGYSDHFPVYMVLIKEVF